MNLVHTSTENELLSPNKRLGGSLVRRSFLLLLAAAIVVGAAVAAKTLVSTSHGPTSALATTVFSGQVSVRLSAHVAGSRSVNLSIHLSGSPSAKPPTVAIKASPLTSERRASSATTRTLPFRNGEYRGAMPLGKGRWIIRVSAVKPQVEATYLLQVSGGSHVPSRIDAFATASTAVKSPPATTIDLNRRPATLQISPGSFGTNTFTLDVPGGHMSSNLQAELTMEDMDMGITRVPLKQQSPGVFSGHGLFSMGGLWRIALVSAAYRSSALLYVNPTTQSARIVPTGAYHPPIVRTDFPYAGFVTEMGTNDVARLNGEITSAGATPHGIDFLAHQPYIYVTDMGGDAVQVVNIHSGRVAHTIPVGLGPAHIVFTPNGRHAFVTDFLSADVSVIDTYRYRLLKRIPVGLNPHGLDITPDGKFVYVACVHGGGVWVLSTSTNKVVTEIPTGLEPYGVAMGRPGSGVVYISDYALNQVDVASLRSRTVIGRIGVGKAPALMVAAPNNYLYVANHNGNSVSVINMRTNRVTTTVPVGAGPHGLDATPDGRYVYVANNNSNTVSVIATKSEKVVETIHVPGRPNEVALQQSDDLHP